MQIYINNPVQSQFGMVPRSLWQAKLSGQAKALVAFLLCVMPGQTVTATVMDEAIGVGRDKGQSVRRELQEAGLISWETPKDRYGRSRGKVLHVDVRSLVNLDPAKGGSDGPAKDGSDRQTNRMPENPSVGKSGITMPETQAYVSDTRKEACGAAMQRAQQASCEQGATEKRERWQRARVAAENGLRWSHPDTGCWHESDAFAEIESMPKPQSAATEASPPNL